MAAFARELDAKYILCTDCSTVFDENMLSKLTDHLECNAGTTAVCGRQRVMSALFQNEGSDKPLRNEFINAPGEYILRQIQTYDFEAVPQIPCITLPCILGAIHRSLRPNRRWVR
jgi:hypothetical protein